MKDLKKDTNSKRKIIDALSVEDALQKISNHNLDDLDVISGSVKLHENSLFHFQEVKVGYLKETLLQIHEMNGENFEAKRTV